MQLSFLKSFALPAIAAIALTSTAALAYHHSDKEKEAKKPDIVDTAVSAGQFNTLIAAAQAAGLDGALASDGPFTVFAPTDDAFAALPPGTVDNLLKPENRDQIADPPPQRPPKTPPIFDGHNDQLSKLHAAGGDPVALFQDNPSAAIDAPRAVAGGFAGGLFAIWIPSPETDGPDYAALAEEQLALVEVRAGNIDAALDRLRAIDIASLKQVSGNPRLGACVGNFGKFLCIGLNYSDHAAETGAKDGDAR